MKHKFINIAMMQVDYIIIGQGISGTWLSYYLLKENKSIIVIDKKNLQSASNVASGLINPVTGRRVVTTWMADELLPFVWSAYNTLGEQLNIRAINQKNILVFPFAPDLQQAFDDRMQQQNSYIQTPSVKKEILYQQFNFPFNVYEINPCYVIQMRGLLQAFRDYLLQQDILLDELFDEEQLIVGEGFVEYKNIRAQKIIYADGIQPGHNKYWKNLPFVQNKGQALVVEVEGLDISYTYKFGHITLIPLAKNSWWAGSSNELNFKTIEPTDDFHKRTVASLQSILKKEFTVKEHWSSLRPATVERRPFVGFHPVFKPMGILNGMGSKGCSLAPWFAKELAKNIVHGRKIDPLADVQRYVKVLTK